jgi:hypothetical protein
LLPICIIPYVLSFMNRLCILARNEGVVTVT